MVTFFGFEKILKNMCNSLSNVSLRGEGKHLFEKNHFCNFRIPSCSSRQLCFLCFLFYYFAIGLCLDEVSTSAVSSISPSLEIRCSGDSCYSKIYSTKKALYDMIESNRYLFKEYSESTNSSDKAITEKGLERLLTDIKIIETAEDHAGHDHESHGDHAGHDHGSHEGHDHGSHDEEFDPSMYGENRSKTDPDYEFYYDLAFGGGDDDSVNDEQNTTQRRKRAVQEIPCISSINELLKTYIRPNSSNNTVQLNFMDLLTLMPQLVLNIKRPECRIVEEEKENNEKENQLAMWKIWLISFGSVAIISVVSLIGVLLIPLIKRSIFFHRLIGFLVALAVGTLTGDALLHLLPHASGLHDHSSDKGHEGHDHGDDDEDHFNLMWKGLVACGGIYLFFLLETIMGIIRNKKTCAEDKVECLASPCTSPSKSDPKLNKDVSSPAQCSPSQSNSPLLSVTIQSNKTTPSCEMPNGTAHCVHGGMQNGKIANSDNECTIAIEDFHVDTGHHHHHSHKVPQNIASLAWMVILGDGLHNMTDGLAIGAAFTSSIGTGLGTSLAIFFHEIPQELGDFAILLNSGMTAKQALLYNFLSACLCFVGLVIGLLVGEYTSGFIFWILALTAGGFLYIALVDMLPTMIKALEHKDYFNRFIIQNIGMLTGFGIMVIIALREDSFNDMF